MKGSKIVQQSVLYLKRHSPVILTCIGSIGVVTTAALTAKATIKAVKLLNEAEIDKRENLTTFETILVAYPSYIPAVLSGVATIACIFGANILNTRQQAALTSAYIFMNRTFEDYKTKINELYGKETGQTIQKEIVKSKMETEDRPSNGRDSLLFYEEHYGKFFERSMLEVQEAEYQLNRKLATEGEVSLNDFFYFLGLPEQEIGDVLGWSQEVICDFLTPPWIDFEHDLVETDDGLECYIINILASPNVNY